VDIKRVADPKENNIMRLVRFFVAAAVVLASTAAFGATALAAGKAPQGNGLSFLIAGDPEEHFTNLVCDDQTQDIEDFLVPRGGNPGWLLATDGEERMYVLTSISGAITVSVPGSDPETYNFSQSFGNRLGKTDVLTCTGEFGHTHDGVTEQGPMTLVLARIW
jgi:hypothetical protein